MSGGGRRRLQDQSSGPRSPFGMSSAVIPLARRASVGGSTGAGGPGPRRAEMRDVRGSGPRRGHPQGSDPARWCLPPRRARRSDGHCRAHGTAAASVRTGICSPGGPRPGVPARGRGADRLDRAVRHLLAGITPPPLRAALGRTLTHPSHVVLNPADEQQAAATPSTPAGAWLCNPEQAPENHHPGPDGPRPPLSCLAEWTSSGIATVVRMGEHDLSRRTLSNAVLRTVPCFCRTTDTTITRHHVPRPRGWKP